MKSTIFKRYCQQVQQGWFSIAVVVLRIVLGLQFFLAGVSKFGDWSAAGYLEHASGPFSEFFLTLAGLPWVDAMNQWGLLAIGAALILGIAVRPASFFGAILMVLYYVSDFDGNTAHGLIDSHVIYFLVFVVFLAGGAGHVFGLDGLVRRFFHRKDTWANWLFG
jgi:thiosulfate dehydrogenase (quinone) large subunit